MPVLIKLNEMTELGDYTRALDVLFRYGFGPGEQESKTPIPFYAEMRNFAIRMVLRKVE